jgi:hypothetical protein
VSARATEWSEPRDALDVALLGGYRRLGPRVQRAFFDAICRTVDDGQPFEEAMIEMLIEVGYSPARAPRGVSQGVSERSRYRLAECAELIDQVADRGAALGNGGAFCLVPRIPRPMIALALRSVAVPLC